MLILILYNFGRLQQQVKMAVYRHSMAPCVRPLVEKAVVHPCTGAVDSALFTAEVGMAVSEDALHPEAEGWEAMSTLQAKMDLGMV